MFKKFISCVLPGVIKPIRIVWNQVIGFVFLAMAVLSARSVYKAFSEFDGGGQSIFRAALTAIFAALMLFFGLSSFWRARKISKT